MVIRIENVFYKSLKIEKPRIMLATRHNVTVLDVTNVLQTFYIVCGMIK